MIARRGLLLGAGVLILGAGVGWRWLPGPKRRRLFQAALEQGFGPEIARTPAAREFLIAVDRYYVEHTASDSANPLVRWRRAFQTALRLEDAQWTRNLIAVQFAQSTNVIAAQETGDPLEFLGIYDPHAFPCSNPLSYFNAP